MSSLIFNVAPHPFREATAPAPVAVTNVGRTQICREPNFAASHFDAGEQYEWSQSRALGICSDLPGQHIQKQPLQTVPWHLQGKDVVYVNPFLCMIFQHAENESSISKETDYANEILVSDDANHNRLSGYVPILTSWSKADSLEVTTA